jgi:DNA-directed RNA polymerase specialized sigma24 family protein
VLIHDGRKGKGFVTGENRVVSQLRGVAAKLTYDVELQKDLLQEMFIHLVRVEVELPGHTPSWYIKSCEFHARNYLKHGRSIDSLKRSKNLIPLGQCYEDVDGHVFCFIDVADPLDVLSEVMTKDIVDLVMPRLTEMQQEILLSLMNGMGVREVARELGISHPAVIKHRRRIARIAGEFIRETETNSFTRPCRGEGVGTVSMREPAPRHSRQLALV